MRWWGGGGRLTDRPSTDVLRHEFPERRSVDVTEDTGKQADLLNTRRPKYRLFFFFFFFFLNFILTRPRHGSVERPTRFIVKSASLRVLAELYKKKKKQKKRKISFL